MSAPEPMSEELLPCPFCGGRASIIKRGTMRQSMIVGCNYCGARVESIDVVGLTPIASWAWNKRRDPGEARDAKMDAAR